MSMSLTDVNVSNADLLQLCTLMSAGGWTVERDEDLTAPYAFHDTTWVAFDDPTSVSIKVSSTTALSYC